MPTKKVAQNAKKQAPKKTQYRTPKKRTGPKSKFIPEYLKIAKYMALAGMTDEQMAKDFGVSRSTLSRWKIDYPEFSEVLSQWKSVADEKVERSLYERATGYSHPDLDIKVIKGKIVKTELIKHYPPETVAAIFWLKNRNPEKWRDKQELDHNIKTEQPLFGDND